MLTCSEEKISMEGYFLIMIIIFFYFRNQLVFLIMIVFKETSTNFI